MLAQGLLNSQVEGEADGAAHEPAHDVALFFVAGHNTVNGQEGCAAQVVGDHAHSVGVSIIFFAGKFFEFLDNWPETSNFENIRAVDSRCRNALQAAAKIDVLLRQRFETALDAYVFHKHIVAD